MVRTSLSAILRHGFDGVYHGYKTVRPSGRKILLQADFRHEAKVIGRNLRGRTPGVDADKKGDDSLGDDGVTVGPEIQLSVLYLVVQPHAGLASLDHHLRRGRGELLRGLPHQDQRL